MTKPWTLMREDEPISLSEVIETATELGVTGLPPAAVVSTGRVWPAGDEWVAELGEPPNTHALDSLLATKEAAWRALTEEIGAERDRLADRLRAAGGSAARLAETRTRWVPPTLYTWDSDKQREPEVHTAGVR